MVHNINTIINTVTVTTRMTTSTTLMKNKCFNNPCIASHINMYNNLEWLNNTYDNRYKTLKCLNNTCNSRYKTPKRYNNNNMCKQQQQQNSFERERMPNYSSLVCLFSPLQATMLKKTKMKRRNTEFGGYSGVGGASGAAAAPFPDLKDLSPI